MAPLFLVFGLLTTFTFISASPTPKRNPYTFVLINRYGDTIFELGNVSYLANTKQPKATTPAECTSKGIVPITVIKTNEPVITKDILEKTVSSYLSGDDIFSHDFLDGLYISSSVKTKLDGTAVGYLNSLNTSFIFTDKKISSAEPLKMITINVPTDIPAGPYLAALSEGLVSFATVYRLYPDTYRTFLFGAYDANDGDHNHYPLGVFLPKFWDPMIP